MAPAWLLPYAATWNSGTKGKRMMVPANNSKSIPIKQFKEGSCENGSIEDSFLYEKSIMHRIGVGYLCFPETNSLIGLLKGNAELNPLLRSGSGRWDICKAWKEDHTVKDYRMLFLSFQSCKLLPFVGAGREVGVCRQFQGVKEAPRERSKKSCLDPCREETWWDTGGSLLFLLVYPALESWQGLRTEVQIRNQVCRFDSNFACVKSLRNGRYKYI